MLNCNCVVVPIHQLLLPQISAVLSISSSNVFNFHATRQCSTITISVQAGRVRQRNTIAGQYKQNLYPSTSKNCLVCCYLHLRTFPNLQVLEFAFLCFEKFTKIKPFGITAQTVHFIVVFNENSASIVEESLHYNIQSIFSSLMKNLVKSVTFLQNSLNFK